MKRKIKDIRDALKNGTYYCALALALTLPDICCQVENGLAEGDNSDRAMYVKWVNKHMKSDDFNFPVQGFETQTFRGEMCYSLRCKILHNGNTKVNNVQRGVNVCEFQLTFPDDSDYFHGYRYKEAPNGETFTEIGVDYLCERICDAAESFYANWPNKNDFSIRSF